MPEFKRILCWFRRDLRDFDHAALAAALGAAERVWCVFIFDTAILDRLVARADRRVEFILESVAEVDAALRGRGGGLIVRHGDARSLIPAIAQALEADAVFVNRDYEPGAKLRDNAVTRALAQAGIAFRAHKDQVIFQLDEVRTRAGHPYTVYTPYRNAWLAALTPACMRPHVVASHGATLQPDPERKPLPALADLGFTRTNLAQIPIATGMTGGRRMLDAFLERIDRYAATRDFPALDGTSNLSVPLRFGTVSIRTLVAEAHARMIRGDAYASGDARGGGDIAGVGDDAVAGHDGAASAAQRSWTGAATWLSELIWRDFYFMVLDHNPHVVDHAFKPEFDRIGWGNDPALFAAWCEGRTGYPLIDAAMRQINSTGMMHNRLRMVSASFLTKDLHVDWRMGERYFAAHLNDYDLAANNGGWQWAASTGCDAQPYFRIFNPVTQSQRFDPDGAFIRRFVPELAAVPDRHIHAPWKMDASLQRKTGVVVGRDYPQPIVDHDAARRVALAMYGVKPAGKR